MNKIRPYQYTIEVEYKDKKDKVSFILNAIDEKHALDKVAEYMKVIREVCKKATILKIEEFNPKISGYIYEEGDE